MNRASPENTKVKQNHANMFTTTCIGAETLLFKCFLRLSSLFNFIEQLTTRVRPSLLNTSINKAYKSFLTTERSSKRLNLESISYKFNPLSIHPHFQSTDHSLNPLNDKYSYFFRFLSSERQIL